MMTFITVILAQSLLYPPVTELFRHGKALTSESCRTPEAKIFVSDQKLLKQRKLYTVPSPALRSDLARYFGESANKKSGKILLELLSKEKSDPVRCDLIKALINLKKQGIDYTLPANFSAYFTENAASIAVKSYAMELYALFYPAKAVPLILETVRKQPQSYLLAAAYDILKKYPARPDQKVLLALYKSSCRKDRGNALHRFSAGLLARQKLTDDLKRLLQKELSKDGPELLHCCIAQGLAENPAAYKDLLEKCALSRYLSVRMSVSQMKSLSGEKWDVLSGLCADRSHFVRETASATLGREIPADTRLRNSIVMTLTGLVRDRNKTVRQKAVESLLKCKLSATEKAQLLAAGNEFAPAREELIFYALHNREKSYAPAITGYLGSFREGILICKALTVLGELRHTPAVRSVMKQASAKDPLIRQAAAEALGKLKMKVSFPVLKKLLRDRNAAVSTAAAKSMFQIGDKAFIPDFQWVLRSRTTERADQRSYAVHFLTDKVDLLPKRTWTDLETLLLKNCIVEPMSPPMPEVAEVRVSVLMLLKGKADKGNRTAKTLLAKAMKELSAKTKEDLADETFFEYLNQFSAYHEGRKIVRGKIHPVEPQTVVNVYEK